jgi:hypothetical protein
MEEKMERRKTLGIVILVVYLALILMFSFGGRGGGLLVTLIGLLLLVPIFSSRYAVKDLQRESYLSWFFLSMMPHVPILLLFERPVKPVMFTPDMKLAGQEAPSFALGELTHFFTVRAHSQLGWKITSFILAFMFAPMLVLPFLSKESASSTLGNLLPFVFVVALGVLFIWLINKQEKKSSQRFVALFTEGLACAWPGEEIRKVRWDEVLEVWQDFRDQYVNGIRTVHRRRCRLTVRGMQPGLEFSEKLLGIEELTSLVHQQVTPFLLKHFGVALSEGQCLDFGKLSVSDQGVGLKKDLLPWADLAGIYLDSGFMVIARNARSSTEARVHKGTQGLSAFASRIVGTAQPFSPGGDAVIWKKTPIDGTPNPVTLSLLVGEVLEKLSPAALA